MAPFCWHGTIAQQKTAVHASGIGARESDAWRAVTHAQQVGPDGRHISRGSVAQHTQQIMSPSSPNAMLFTGTLPVAIFCARDPFMHSQQQHSLMQHVGPQSLMLQQPHRARSHSFDMLAGCELRDVHGMTKDAACFAARPSEAVLLYFRFDVQAEVR